MDKALQHFFTPARELRLMRALSFILACGIATAFAVVVARMEAGHLRAGQKKALAAAAQRPCAIPSASPARAQGEAAGPSASTASCTAR